MTNTELSRMRTAPGFIAALDQSGGSTPGALAVYGVDASAFTAQDGTVDESKMYELVHQMRSRIMTSPSFTGDRILAAILFRDTLVRQVNGIPTAEYLQQKGISTIVKIDEGLAEEQDGVQMMKTMVKLDELLGIMQQHPVFGTKMRSVIHIDNQAGIDAVVKQQLEYAQHIIDAGFIPIIEPEVNIKAENRASAERYLAERLKAGLPSVNGNVMLKLTLPVEDNLYQELTTLPNVVRVVALSGGFSRDEANQHLAQNKGVVASFSRALSEGLSAQQSDEDFGNMLDTAIQSIFEASNT
jgi:fructose-bisphosphate aldolase, class I